jgi:UDP:flavonoid glycosyltransferase YjiC (YdhE family)
VRTLFNVAGGYGHLYPIVPLAQALIDAGHDVAVAIPEHFADTVRQVGLDCIPLAAPGVSDPSDEYKAQQQNRLPVERGRVALGRYLDHALVQLPALGAAAVEWRADVLVRETTAFTSWLVGELLGLPVAVFDFAPTAPKLLAATAGDLFERTRDAAGLPPDPMLRTLRRWLHLVAAPPGWFPAASLGESTHLFQPPADVGRHAQAPQWLARRKSSRPFVYVTLGTFFNSTPGLFDVVFQVLADEPVEALATVGRDIDPGSLRWVPPNVRVERFLPQASILPWIDAMISHGGYGTLMGALRHGVPVVSMPLAASDDTPNAQRIAALGAGIALTEDARSGDAIRAALRAVLTKPAYRDSARRIARSIEELPPLSAAVDLLERLATQRQPIPGPWSPPRGGTAGTSAPAQRGA